MTNECKTFLECDYLQHLFHYIRVVDPINKIVIKENGNSIIKKCKCFEVWDRKGECENCISIRAYNENTSVMKVEYYEDKIYMIIANPININGCKYVVEAIRDITECKIMDLVDDGKTEDIRSKFDKMNKLIVTDELTQCYNRRYINEKLPIDVDKAKRDNSKLSIAMVDIDNFKIINDQYGHLAGDEVLRKVCSIIKNNIRTQGDWIARYGGEEFLILFNNASKDEACNLSNRIKLIIEKSIIKYNNIEINITISIGIATINKEINTTDKLIKKADENLYKAKELGRNLVVT